MTLYYEQTLINAYLIGSSKFKGMKHEAVESTDGINFVRGDVLLGFKYTNKKFPHVFIIGYTYITGKGETDNNVDDMIDFCFSSDSWINSHLKNRSDLLEALYGAYYNSAYKHLGNTAQETIEKNIDIVYAYGNRLIEYKEKINSLKPNKGNVKIVRSGKYAFKLDEDGITYIVINSKNNKVFLNVYGNNPEFVESKLGIKMNKYSTGNFIFLPSYLKDISIDTIESIING